MRGGNGDGVRDVDRVKAVCWDSETGLFVVAASLRRSSLVEQGVGDRKVMPHVVFVFTFFIVIMLQIFPVLY